MGRITILFAILFPALCLAQDGSIVVDDLLNLANVSPKGFDSYLEKKGFSIKRRSLRENQMAYSYYEKETTKPAVGNSLASRRIDVYKKTDTWFINFHTSSLPEYEMARKRLKKMNMFWSGQDADTLSPLLFQRLTLTVLATIDSAETGEAYSIQVRKKELPAPASIQYAEDLLGFDSHEYLVSFFGSNNVKKDKYYFSDTESKNCSVLFPNTSDQAVFIWDDEGNYRKLSYILISGLLSTPGATHFTGSFGQNRWMLKNGIYPGMRIGDLLKLNANDFEFFGKESEYTYMVEPKVTGNINFKWIGVGLNCFNCDQSEVLDHAKVRATDAVKNELSLHVSYIMLKP
jgi:hypothetical protein